MDMYGNKMLLCSEICHKLLNFDTVWDVMQKCYNRGGGSYKENCMSQIVGQTVMTNYNNKTYRIDDINWNVTPKDTFDLKNGSKISFVDYYYDHYKLKIRELGQPLLVSLPKAKDAKRGNDTPILLVPELCVLTGLNFFFLN